MARTFGKFTTTIYDSEEFRALTFEQQGVYFMLGLQGEISAAGILPLRLRRWTRNAADATVDRLLAGLAVLANLGHVVYDEETEELLMVKFVKWDKGYVNEKRRPVVAEAAREIASSTLRAVLADEVRKLADDVSDMASDMASEAAAGFLRDMASDMASDTASDMASDTASHRASDTQSRFDRSVVTEGEYITPNPKPQSGSREPSADDAAAEPSPFCSKHPNGTEQPCGPCGTANRRHKAWLAAAPERERRAKAAIAKRLAAVAACPDCAGSHWRDDGSKCTHGRIA